MTDPFVSRPWEEEPEGEQLADLQTILRRQKEALAAVATGTSIATKEEEYSHRERRIRSAYRKLGLANPFPWPDLYSFWVYIRDEWPTYAERRAELTRLLNEALDALDATEDQHEAIGIPAWDLPLDETWTGLAQRALDLKARYETALTLDDRQDVGRRSRQIIIEGVKLAWEPHMVPEGEDPPRADDTRTKLTQILSSTIPGADYERLRKFIKGALDLSNETTHAEGQEGVEAMLSAMGAMMSVRILQELDRISHSAEGLK